jgi:aryl-alcohol dehydrogenase-like predicted oxidoreductase
MDPVVPFDPADASRRLGQALIRRRRVSIATGVLVEQGHRTAEAASVALMWRAVHAGGTVVDAADAVIAQARRSA